MAEHYNDHDVHVTDDVNSNKVLIAKAVTMVVLCSVSTLMGLFPMQLAKWLKWNTSGNIQNPRSTQLVALLLGFGGGILFCTTFLHMIPEVSEGVNNLVKEGTLPNLTFSLAEMLTCCGFFIMYLVEELVHTHLRKRKSKKEKDIKTDMNRSTNELVENGQIVSSYANGHSHANGHGHSHHLSEIIDVEDDFMISSLRGLLIVLGLSVHELFEGLAIGLERSESYVWYMFAAVAAHKFVIAFCIGVELTAARTRRYLSIIYVCTFAIVSPLGIGIGMILVGGESAPASGPLAVILQGLASGTLLYVVFFEILQEHRTGLRQYLSILIGFLVMFGLQMLTAHSHSHSHSHSHLQSLGHAHSHSHEHEDENEDKDIIHEEVLGRKSMHSHETSTERVVGDAIDRVTQNIVDVLSKSLASSASPRTHHEHLHENYTLQDNTRDTLISTTNRSK